MIGRSVMKIGGYVVSMILAGVVFSSPAVAAVHCQDVTGLSPQAIEIVKVKLRVEHVRFQRHLISGHTSMSVTGNDGRYREVIQRVSQGMAPPITFDTQRTDSGMRLCASPRQS